MSNIFQQRIFDKITFPDIIQHVISKSQAKRITLTASQLGLLLLLFVVLGFLLPIYLAPGIANFLGVTTPYEAARQTLSVRLSGRNLNDGDAFRVAVSNPGESVRISSLSYSCEYPEIQLAYLDGETPRQLPCDTALSLPERPQHELIAFTQKESVTYMPVNLTVTDAENSGEISVVVAIAASNIDQLSDLADDTTATLQSLPTAR